MGTLEKGIQAYNENRYEETIKLLTSIESLDSFDKEEILKINKYLGMSHYRLANYMKAISYYKNCLIIAEEFKDNKLIFEAKYNMISVYCAISDFEKVKDLIAEILTIAENDGDKFYIGKSYNALGAMCIDSTDENNIEAKRLALKYFQKGIEAIKNCEYYDLEAMIYSNLGYAYSKLGKIKLALDNLFIALNLSEKNDTFVVKPFALFTVAETYFKDEKVEEALMYLNQAIDIFKFIGERHRVAEAYKLYSDIYEKKEDFKQALEYERLYSSLMLDIKNNDYINMMSKSQMEYDLLKAEKDKEIYRIKNEELNKLNSELSKLNEELHAAYKEVNRLSERDYLTSTYNRRGVANRVSKLIKTEVNGVILFDIDWFKKINDKYGHDAGDKVLKQMVDRIMYGIDDEFTLGRWGGEEFLVILPNKNKEETYDFCLKVFDVMEPEFYIDNAKINITITAGVDTFKNYADFEAGVKRVDIKLYQGKQNGRNIIIA
ncbi:tetratricopeptide repeat-containing diguanylate cyclase [Inconstantimicrobium mannanitabidum]|uniref:Uncharacterized protein n=1 Tax=Inconstantimicrobium mannanitabidum TaxID=1604901 RepID=A0ACB5R6D2_9CLOT|nr:diguanylate cyclase [Clostridium sp. TW13]GKX64799.1 hypothetical protein rsdtw13_00570 [Clostridium sp. TW13]